MPRLTKRLVDQLTPSAQEYFVWDALLPGFGVRVLPSGRCSYLVQYRDAHGRTRRYTLGPHGVLTPDAARSLARSALARVRAGANPAQATIRATPRRSPPWSSATGAIVCRSSSPRRYRITSRSWTPMCFPR